MNTLTFPRIARRKSTKTPVVISHKGILIDVTPETANEILKKERATYNRKAKHEAMLDLGLVKVKGAMGGTYYE